MALTLLDRRLRRTVIIRVPLSFIMYLCALMRKYIMKEVIVYGQVSRDHPVSRIRSQPNQHCPQLQCIKDNCQQGIKGSEGTEPHMAIGSKTNRSGPLWIAFPKPESKKSLHPSVCRIMPTSARNFSATE